MVSEDLLLDLGWGDLVLVLRFFGFTTGSAAEADAAAAVCVTARLERVGISVLDFFAVALGRPRLRLAPLPAVLAPSPRLSLRAYQQAVLLLGAPLRGRRDFKREPAENASHDRQAPEDNTKAARKILVLEHAMVERKLISKESCKRERSCPKF